MASSPRFLIDTNVVLDVLAKREPHYATSAAVWALAEGEVIQGLIAAHTITTLHYLITKNLNHKRANLAITKLLQVFEVASVGQDVLLKALALNWPDFEDAVQMAAAFEAHADYLVTQNPKDFRDEMVLVIQPGELLALFPKS